MQKTQLSADHIEWQSLALPIVLIVTGFILIIGSWIGVLSLDRIQDLWPGALIVIGLTELTPWSGSQGQPAGSFDHYEKENYRAR
ncbi:MAG: hypothetical protein JO097_20840 [Acidobacteriaceae bacterium]|nr:hypothetical protein [Acidobacteriaceae bacterium]MBV9296547.1 hypothetical protein [Acidobacteriaceae bacterium]MBV9765621.1 hypothetical protein [Acidobacteriaceae bacterium]